MVDDGHTRDGAVHGAPVPHVAADHLDVRRPFVRVVDVEDSHAQPGRAQLGDEESPEVPRASGDEVNVVRVAAHSMTCPLANIHETDRRMPSSKSTFGAYPSSRSAFSMVHAIVLSISESTWIFW